MCRLQIFHKIYFVNLLREDKKFLRSQKSVFHQIQWEKVLQLEGMFMYSRTKNITTFKNEKKIHFRKAEDTKCIHQMSSNEQERLGRNEIHIFHRLLSRRFYVVIFWKVKLGRYVGLNSQEYSVMGIESALNLWTFLSFSRLIFDHFLWTNPLSLKREH